MHSDFMHNGTRERRALVLFCAVGALFGILGIRLYLLQITDWEQYRIQSEKNTMQPIPIEANRGLIRDRNGVILVDNRPSYTISVIPPRLPGKARSAVRQNIITRLSEIIDLPNVKIEERLSSRNRHFYEPVKLKLDVGFETISILEENRYDLPGVEIQIESRRGYPTFDGDYPLAPHVLGHVGLLDAEQYPQMRAQGYRFGDQIGKRGVESLAESRLRGRDGVKYVEVNARGREVGSFPDKTEPPVAGEDMWLTLDWRLQYAAEHVFPDSLRGSLIAMSPQTGEILAMVSKPGFHPSALRDPQAWRALLADPANPLLNRTIQGEYPPASVFKMIAGIAALDMGLLSADEYRFQPCYGGYQFGDRFFRCHNHDGCGALNLREAIVRSCDTFFYQLGREIGIANWSRYSRMFGFGRPTGIDLAGGGDGEAGGLVPDRAYYQKRHGRWVDGNMLNLTIGQGEMLATPLQVAQYTSALASGVLATPHIIKSTEVQATPVPIAPHILQTMRGIMRDVVAFPHGTGRNARLPDVTVAGKTGTAQNPHGKSHAWFVAFAPLEAPRISVTVLVENGGSGSGVAAPIARAVLEAYFKCEDEEVSPNLMASRKSDIPAPVPSR